MNVPYDIPAQYWITTTTYRCRRCGASSAVRRAPGGEMVRFVNDGGQERWLPTYGVGGYLELLERLVAGYSRNQEISASVAQRFKTAFALLVSSAKGVSEFALDERGPACTQCGSKDLDIVGELTDSSPPVQWLEYPEPEATCHAAFKNN